MDQAAFDILLAEFTPLFQMLCARSRIWAADEEQVIAGGGNVSVKCSFRGEWFVFIKRSGMTLRHLQPADLVGLRAAALLQLLGATFSSDPTTREDEYKSVLMAARIMPALGQRASVESAMHMLGFRYVVHFHTTLVNMITCCLDGRRITQELFGDRVCFLDYVFPGIVLAKVVAANSTGHQFQNGAQVYFLGNHGVVFVADELDVVQDLIDAVLGPIRARLATLSPSSANAAVLNASEEADGFGHALVSACNKRQVGGQFAVCHLADDVVTMCLSHPEAKDAALAGPLTPDQVVYCKPDILWLEPHSRVGDVASAVQHFLESRQYLPRVVLHPSLGLFTLGANATAATTAQRVYRDAMRIAHGARLLGGVKHMTAAEAWDIERWEVEAFRRNAAT